MKSNLAITREIARLDRIQKRKLEARDADTVFGASQALAWASGGYAMAVSKMVGLKPARRKP